MGRNRVTAHAGAARPFLITFSGVDGAGKTTQIEQLSESLQKSGLRVTRLSFWDDVAFCSNLRAGAGGRVAESQEAGETSGGFVPRNNKHIRKWYLTLARSGLYMMDVVRLRRLLARESIKHFDVVIFDRYVYDQIANIDSSSRAARIYGEMVLSQTPRPDLAFVIDASPTAAFARKPEYPLEFVHRNRQTFLRLQEIAPELNVISEGSAEEVGQEIWSYILQSRLLERSLADTDEEATPEAVVCQRSSCRGRNEPTAGV